MKPSETIRCTCDECLVVFEVFLAPVADWPEEMEDLSDAVVEIGDLYCCPFCGSSDIRQALVSHSAPQP